MPQSFPVALHLTGKPCLVVGSNDEAAQRALALADAGAHVHVVAPAADPALASALTERGIRVEYRSFSERDLDDKWLAVLTDRDAALARAMATAAAARRVLFCATDQPVDNSFSHMALARAGLVTAAISTEGRAPALGRRLRQELSRLFAQAGLAEFATKLAALRERTPSEQRRDVLGEAVSAVHISGELWLPRDR